MVRAYKRGQNRSQIGEEVGLSYTTVGNTLKRFVGAGMQGLVSGKCGRPVFFGWSLTKEQAD